MKNNVVFACILVILSSGSSRAVENCCGLYSPGNDFVCGPHDNDPTKNGNCVWYARYKRPEVDGICTGNASKWYDQAKNGGLAVGQVAVVGSIAVFKWSTQGHVAYVESINADGSFNVSEMGWNTWDGVHYGKWTKTSLGGLIGFIYPVGCYSDGFHADGSSQAFIDAFNRHYPEIGWPVDKGGGMYVHSWASRFYPNYHVWIQDFQGDLNTDHFGEDGQSAIILSGYFQPKKAFLVKEGMWEYYKNHNGQFELGEPYTEEIVDLKLSNSPYNLKSDLVKAGDTITVQKFYRVYGNQRKTLIFNNSRMGEVINFPVGEFSITGDVCPPEKQIYVYVDSDPGHDIPWPKENQKTPTGKWFTKPGQYNFVRHEANGQRLAGWGVSAVISEGNSQSFGRTILTPTNLKIEAETPDSVRLVFSLPGGLAGYNIRVYQNSQQVTDLPAMENCLVSGLSANTYYCFRVSVVDNASSIESDRSAEACATTPLGYEFVRTALCKNVDMFNFNDPINETAIFYNTDKYVYSWLELGNVYGTRDIKWSWFDPSGNLAYEDFPKNINPYSMALMSGRRCKAWCAYNFATNNSYGNWRVKTYVDGNLAADKSFSLIAAGNNISFRFGQMITCKNGLTNRPPMGAPVNETTVFYNRDNFVYSWVIMSNVSGTRKINWRWLDPGGNSAGESVQNILGPIQGFYWSWCSFDISANRNYGTWQVATYLENNFVAKKSFSLAPTPSIAVTSRMVENGASGLRLTMFGLTNSAYTVQTATNALGPWTDYITVYGQSNGVGTFTVPNTPSARFFQ